MINILKLIFFILFFSSCSLSNTGGFWSNEKDLKNQRLEFENLYKKDELILKEFNKNF